MPSLSGLSDFVALNIGAFEKGKWDYTGLAQLYPQLEVLGQLVPRKQSQTNYEATVVFQTETQSPGHGAKPGDPVQPVNNADMIRRKIKMVKYMATIGWTQDQENLQGKSDEHIVKEIQTELVAFDLHFWQDLEHMMLKLPDNILPADDETMYGVPAWVTDDADIADDTFELYGGDDPYSAGRPGSISVNDQPKFTNPVAKFSTVSDDNLFEFVEQFLIHRKLMGAVPNPRLLPDTPNDVWYMQAPLYTAITRYLTASNENIGMDAGRYRGKPTYKGIPITVWHALGHTDSPVRATTCESYILDWNSFAYCVHPEYDRKIEGPKEIPLTPGGIYVNSQLWHQTKCDRPDRNLKLVSDTPSLQP